MLPIRTVLHPTDFSERAGYAFAVAHALARDYGARLIVLHVASKPPGTASGEDYQAALQDKLRWLHVPDSRVEVEPRLREGDPVTEILQTARASKCDVIIMGTRARGEGGRARSIAEVLVQQAPCPVVTVNRPFVESEPTPEFGPEAAVACA